MSQTFFREMVVAGSWSYSDMLSMLETLARSAVPLLRIARPRSLVTDQLQLQLWCIQLLPEPSTGGDPEDS